MQSVVRNDCPNGWVVQKFGGTSVGKFPEKVRLWRLIWSLQTQSNHSMGGTNNYGLARRSQKTLSGM